MGKKYTDPLEFLLAGEAESLTDGRCTNLKPSKELRAIWTAWEDAVYRALKHWAETVDFGNETSVRMYRGMVKKLTETEMYAYDVYTTLAGAGVGIWDGRWEKYFPEHVIEKLESRLKTLLKKAYANMEQALQNEVFNQCESN